jgi:biopolymer transport protein ExbD
MGLFGEINVTPLIDVVMCLIIFYLMVGKLATDRKTRVNLPDSAIGAEAEPQVLVVNVLPGGQAGRVIVENKPLEDAASLELLVRDRLDAQPGTIVQIRAEQDLPFGIVSPVMLACTKAGAKDVRLAAERVGGGR